MTVALVVRVVGMRQEAARATLQANFTPAGLKATFQVVSLAIESSVA